MYSVSLMEYNTTPTSDIPTPSTDELYIYEPLTSDEGLILTEPVLYLESSSVGSFSCNIPETNYGYGKIIKRRTRVIVRKDDKVIFMGRINSEDRDLYLTEKIEAEGALAYLNDSLTEKKTYSYKSLPYILNDIFTNHNSKFPNEPWKQFNFLYDAEQDISINCKAEFTGRDDTNVESKKITQYNINFDITMEIVTELLVIANAVLKIDYNDTSGKWDVYIYKKYDYATDGSNFPVNSQPIEFGVNLIDLMQSYDKTDYCTAVAPFGGDLIPESKEIGEAVAGYIGDNPESIYDKILIRGPHDYDYVVWDVSEDPEFAGSGYWAFEFDIEAYNNAHPNRPLKKLYLSWRTHWFDTRTGYIADNAWRIISRVDDDYQSLAYHEITSGDGFVSEINEEIDLSDSKYARASLIRMGGWGKLITPLIRRDAEVVEEADKVNISKCDAFNTDEDGLRHPEGSFYLYSDTLINSLGLIEKKLEYNIEDSVKPLDPFSNPYHGQFGDSAVYGEHALGYFVGNVGDEPDLNKHKGEYQIIPFNNTAYNCIEYELPDLTSPNRPRGVYITSRMHHYGIFTWNNKQWLINGMYVFLDTSHQVLSYQAASEADKGVGFTNLKREFIDLSDPKVFGAKYIRVGGYVGSGYPIELIPSDDAYSRNRLMDQAKLYLTSNQWEKSVIEATAVDLNMVNDSFERFDICTLIEVVSDYHGVYTYLPLTRLELHLDNYANNSIKVGYDSDSYLSYQLNEYLRATSVEETVEERRKNNEYTT